MSEDPTQYEDGSVDAGLYLLMLATPRDTTRSQDEIAEACGCSREYIGQLERSAIRKLRAEIVRRPLRRIPTRKAA